MIGLTHIRNAGREVRQRTGVERDGVFPLTCQAVGSAVAGVSHVNVL
jgi:hypothetical protein